MEGISSPNLLLAAAAAYRQQRLLAAPREDKGPLKKPRTLGLPTEHPLLTTCTFFLSYLTLSFNLGIDQRTIPAGLWFCVDSSSHSAPLQQLIMRDDGVQTWLDSATLPQRKHGRRGSAHLRDPERLAY